MDLWLIEKHTPGVKLSIRVDRQLHSGQSEFQRIDMFESEELGRFLTLDGYMMLAERDEFIYHEMTIHVPMAVHPKVRRVLAIDGGDSDAVRELIRCPRIERIDLVETDEQVVTVCREHLPSTTCGLDDPRVKLYFQDGLKLVRRQSEEYDLILVDSTDPLDSGEGLFTREFYGNYYEALRENGIMVNQHEGPSCVVDALAMQWAHKRIVKSFPTSRVHQAHIPTCPSGHWLPGFVSKEYHPLKDMDTKRWKERGVPTRYCNIKPHRGAFALPNYVEGLLRNVEHTD